MTNLYKGVKEFDCCVVELQEEAHQNIEKVCCLMSIYIYGYTTVQTINSLYEIILLKFYRN